MNSNILQVRVDEETKTKAAAMFESLGLDLPTAIRIFLKKSIAVHGLPFDVREEVLNEETIAALEEIKEMDAHPEKYKRYNSFSELLEEVMADA